MKNTKSKSRKSKRRTKTSHPKADQLKLQIDMIPQTSWGKNLRKVLSDSEWKQLREQTLSEFNYKCGICGAEERLQCDEVWEYDDRKHIQRLTGLRVLCSLCHHVKHIGKAGLLAEEGRLDYDKIVEHFMKVNCCDVDTFNEHAIRAAEIWERRSKHEWEIDYGEF